MERVNPGDAGSIFEPAGAGSGPVGGVAIVTQSASLAALFSDEIRTRAWRAAKVANIGNQLDVTHAQLIDWLRRDDETRVIGLHLEAVTDGQRLMAAISGVGKPVVVLRAARTAAGARASSTHSGSSAGEREVYLSALRQAGAVVVSSAEELLDSLEALSLGTGRPGAGKRVGILTASGALGVLAADAAEDAGLEVPVLSSSTQSRLRHLVPRLPASGNPVDVGQGQDAATLAECARAIADDLAVDALIVLGAGPSSRDLAAALRQLTADKAIVGSGLPPAPGFPSFASAERAIAAYRSLVAYGRRRTATFEAARAAAAVPAASVTPMTIEGIGVMDEYEAKRLLDRWEVPVVPETLVTGPGRHEFVPIRKLATHFGYPVVLKAIREDIVHKSEMGAVAVGLASNEELQRAWEQMHERFPNAAWLVQPFLPGDVEVVVSARRDPVFGPVVSFRPGGVIAELYADVALRVAPFDRAEAIEMIEETTAAALMHGFRGLPEHDPAEVADVLVKVGRLMLGQPSVRELEIGPLLLTEKGPIAVSAMAEIG